MHSFSLNIEYINCGEKKKHKNLIFCVCWHFRRHVTHVSFLEYVSLVRIKSNKQSFYYKNIFFLSTICEFLLIRRIQYIYFLNQKKVFLKKEPHYIQKLFWFLLVAIGISALFQSRGIYIQTFGIICMTHCPFCKFLLYHSLQSCPSSYLFIHCCV